MKNLIKSRRGVAIEMAIGAMFIMIALSIVLISISGTQTRHMKNDLDEFDKKVEVYEITDYILKNHKDNQVVEKIGDSDVYSVHCDHLDNTNNYTYTISKTNSVILTLEIKTVTDDNGTTNTITSWRD